MSASTSRMSCALRIGTHGTVAHREGAVVEGHLERRPHTADYNGFVVMLEGGVTIGASDTELGW